MTWKEHSYEQIILFCWYPNFGIDCNNFHCLYLDSLTKKNKIKFFFHAIHKKANTLFLTFYEDNLNKLDSFIYDVHNI